MRKQFQDERQKQRACDALRDRIETKIGQIKLLEDEIREWESEILDFESEIKEARDNFRDLATEFGPTQIPFFSPSRLGNLFTALDFATRQYGAPDAKDVQNAMNEYHYIEMRNNPRISDAQSNIQKANSEIRRIQYDKENLVSELRNLECF